MRVDPPAYQELVAITEVEQLVITFFSGVTGIGGADLVRNDKVVDEQRV